MKETIYGKRLVLFAPLYVSNLCGNECLYCAFRARNRELARRALTPGGDRPRGALARGAGAQADPPRRGRGLPQGGLRLRPEVDRDDLRHVERAGRDPPREREHRPPRPPDEFRRLREAKIGTYQLFQETYHRETYGEGPRGREEGRLRLAAHGAWTARWRRASTTSASAPSSASSTGASSSSRSCSTSSTSRRPSASGPTRSPCPRIEPADGSDLAAHPAHAVSDVDFQKLVAILRLAVPYTGLILSTRETRRRCAARRSPSASRRSRAGSRTNPGGYEDGAGERQHGGAQFSLGDHRPLDEVIRDVAASASSRRSARPATASGRTGADFMDVARPGDIKEHCNPNALATFQEYLDDYGSEETRAGGRGLHRAEPRRDGAGPQREGRGDGRARVRSGRRDVYC